jgi:hypothetical protein
MKRSSSVGFSRIAAFVGLSPRHMSDFEGIPITAQLQVDVRTRSAAVGYELSPIELDAVHGGELNIEVPAYVPLSQSNPKTEVVLTRVPYK